MPSKKDYEKITKQLDAMFDHMDMTFKQMDKTFKTIETYMDEAFVETKPVWKKWFAWHPVKINGKYSWMKTVYRKYNWAKSTEQPFGEGYDYGTIFDVLKDSDKGKTQVSERNESSPPFKGLQDG